MILKREREQDREWDGGDGGLKFSLMKHNVFTHLMTP